MKEITVREYRQDDISKVIRSTDPLPGFEDLLLHGEAYTAIAEDGEYVGCAGVSFYWPGHAEAWVHFTENIRSYIRAPKIIQHHLARLIDKHNLYRVTAHSDATFPESQRFLEYMGFEREGLLKKWGPDKTDYYIYGLVVEDR